MNAAVLVAFTEVVSSHPPRSATASAGAASSSKDLAAGTYTKDGAR